MIEEHRWKRGCNHVCKCGSKWSHLKKTERCTLNLCLACRVKELLADQRESTRMLHEIMDWEEEQRTEPKVD
jgi:hypothetical protein